MSLRVTTTSPLDVTDAERVAWAALEARALESNAFLSPHFVLPALRYLDPSVQAFIVFAWEGEGAASILRGAGVFRAAPPSRAFPLPHLVAYRSCHSYLSGLLVDREQAAETVAALLDALSDASRGPSRRSSRWHGVVFERCRAEGPMGTLLRQAVAQRGSTCHESARCWRSILRPASAGEPYLAGRIKARTAESRRQLRRLRELAPVVWKVHRSGPGLARSVEAHLDLERQGWKGSESSALGSTPTHERFFREMIGGFAAEERALFTELSVGDQTIAVTSNLVSGEGGFSFKLGWAPAYARYSPGVLNEIEFIRHADEVCRPLSYVDSGAMSGSFIDHLWLDRYALTDFALSLTTAGRVSLGAAALVRRWPPRSAPRSAPRAIVLSCLGAPEASLNVVRGLGEGGVPVVLVTEDPNEPAADSRFVQEVVSLPRYTEEPHSLFDALFALTDHRCDRPVLFPTADPDLALIARHQRRLGERFRLLTASSELVGTLMDKRRFAELADRLQLKVPRSFAPNSIDELEPISRALRYPAIVKPASPGAWNVAAVRAIVGAQKAIAVESAGALIALCTRIGEHGLDLLIQELVPGPDEDHVDLHALIAPDGEPVTWFTGRKLRIQPAHAGSGCYVQSVTVPEVVAAGLQALRRCGLTGLANLNFKRHARTGEYLLLEINPRVSQWSILATRSGVNLPLCAYRQACGAPAAPHRPQREGGRYLNLGKDLAAFGAYRREGLLSTAAYLRSVWDPRMTHQYLDSGDPAPFLRTITSGLRARLESRH